MRPRGLLLRLPATLRRRALRVGVAGLVLLLIAPVPMASGSAMLPVPSEPQAPAAGLPPPPGTTTLVSQRFGGGFAGGASGEPSMSADGRYVAFTSGAADLVPGDTNQALDVFVRDLATGTTVRLPLPGGTPVPPGAQASQPSIAADGSVVAFTYQPPPGFTGATAGTIVLAWDRASGTTTIVSRNIRGSAAAGSREPSVSADGRYVAYTSDNTLIVPQDGNGSSDVFRFDRQTNTTVAVSVGVGGLPAGGTSQTPAISDDGNLVAFVSQAGDTIVPENTGSGRQVYLRDIAAGTTERISKAADGGPADGEAYGPSISGDGRYVAFESAATNLVAGDSNAYPDVFRRDRQAGVTALVSVTPAGGPGAGPSGEASITRDGRMVAFTSGAPDILGDVAPGARLAALVTRTSEVFIRDMTAADTVLVSVDPNGQPGGARSFAPSVAGNGRYIAFASSSPALVAGDSNNALDVFLRDLPPVPKLNPSVVDFGTRALNTPGAPLAAILSNAGWGPLAVTGSTVAGANAAEFPIALDGCAKATLYRAEACTVTMTFTPTAAGTRTAVLQVADAYTGSPRTARLVGVGSLAKLVLDPPVGPPGIVTVVTGSGFPPGADVRLAWTAGMTPTLPIVKADAGGGFKIQVLVFHNDVQGTRNLRAEAAGAILFPPVEAPMLVTPPPAMPPGFIALYRFVDLPLVLVIRG